MVWQVYRGWEKAYRDSDVEEEFVIHVDGDGFFYKDKRYEWRSRDITSLLPAGWSVTWAGVVEGIVDNVAEKIEGEIPPPANPPPTSRALGAALDPTRGRRKSHALQMLKAIVAGLVTAQLVGLGLLATGIEVADYWSFVILTIAVTVGLLTYRRL